MCGTASCWAKTAFLVLLVAVCLHIAGWATKSWMTYESSGSVLLVEVGLWQQNACQGGVCVETETDFRYLSDAFNAVRGLETVTFCIAVIALVLLSAYVFVQPARKKSVALILIAICCLAAILSLIGMWVWMLNIPAPFVVSYSLGLTVLAFLFLFMTALLLVPEVCMSGDNNRDDRLDTPSSDRRSVVSPTSGYKGDRFSDGYTNRGY